jgi:hypothetical protein
MQPCHVCGATATDPDGFCMHCRGYRGPELAAVSAPGSGVPADGSPQVLRQEPGVYYSASAGYDPQPPAADQPPAVPARQGARNAVAVPLFMVTVIVVVAVAGAVSVALIRARDNGRQPRSTAAPASASAPASAPGSAPASAAANAAGLDKCVVGEWTITLARYGDADAIFTTNNGGIMRLRADATGEWNFGSGVTYTGKFNGKATEVLITGKMTFQYTTVGRTFAFRNVQSDARGVITQSGKVLSNELQEFDPLPKEYTCVGDALAWMVAPYYEVQMRRK